MKKIMIFLVLVLLVAGCSGNTPVNKDIESYVPRSEHKIITVANWNLQVYGPSKASNENILDFYDEKLSVYDIIFVQEIRDSSGDAFETLCDKFEGYECDISERDGRTKSKEQIGVIYKNYITLDTLTTLKDKDDVWERSPVKAVFDVDGFKFTAYNTHIKPDDAQAEMRAFEEAIVNEGKIMVLGDFNADCDYYDVSNKAFDSWYWLIYDEEDTTVSDTDCAYDRIIVNKNMVVDVYEPKIEKGNITKEFSDHYIVSVEVNVGI